MLGFLRVLKRRSHLSYRASRVSRERESISPGNHLRAGDDNLHVVKKFANKSKLKETRSLLAK